MLIIVFSNIESIFNIFSLFFSSTFVPTIFSISINKCSVSSILVKCLESLQIVWKHRWWRRQSTNKNITKIATTTSRKKPKTINRITLLSYDTLTRHSERESCVFWVSTNSDWISSVKKSTRKRNECGKETNRA